MSSGRGARHFSLRSSPSQDSSHPDRFLLVGCWESITDHDDLDIRGLVPKILKSLYEHFRLEAAYFLYVDAGRIGFEEEEIGVDVFHVKEGKKEEFEKVVEGGDMDGDGGTRGFGGREISGGWYVTKKMPPLPRVMPTDEGEKRMLEEGRERAERRLREPTPEIFVIIEGLEEGKRVVEDGFDREVEGLVEKVERGVYEKFLDGRREEGLEEK